MSKSIFIQAVLSWLIICATDSPPAHRCHLPYPAGNSCTASSSSAPYRIDVCYFAAAADSAASGGCKTFENLTRIREFITADHVRVEIHDQTLTKVRKYSLARVRHVWELIIRGCAVIDVEPGAFAGAFSLRKLDLRHNHLKRIRSGVFNRLFLVELNLSINEIETIEEKALSDMVILQRIDLRHNLISVYEAKWFSNTPQLSRLHFENNSIKTIPERAFESLNNDRNNVEMFFSFNNISFIHPDAFEGMERAIITKLYLDHNLLRFWNSSWSKNINDLKISFNNIECVYGDLRSLIKNSFLHNFAHNPYKCDCLKEIKSVADELGDYSVWFGDNYWRCRDERKPRKLPHGTAVRNIQIFHA